MNDVNNLLVLSNANAFISKILERINNRERLADKEEGTDDAVDKNNEATKLGALTLTRLIGGAL